MRKIGESIWHRRWAILLLMLVASVIAAMAADNITPMYNASARLLIDNPQPKVVNFSQAVKRDRDTKMFQATQVALLKSRALATEVVQELKLQEHPEFDSRQMTSFTAEAKDWLGGLLPMFASEKTPATEEQLLRGATSRFMQQLTITPQGNSQLILIEVEMADAKTAALAASAVAHGYIEQQLKMGMNASDSSNTWMSGRLAELAVKLKESEDKLQAYRDSHGLIDTHGADGISAGQMAQNTRGLIDAQRARSEAEYQYRQVQNANSGNWEDFLNVPLVMNNDLVRRFTSQRAVAQARYNQLSNRYGPLHPEMEAASTELKAATAALRTQVQQIIASTRQTYQLAQNNENAIKSSLDQNKSQLQDISRKSFELDALQREVDSNQALYDTFVSRLKQNAATSDIGSGNTRVVDEGVTPRSAITPTMPMLVIAGAFAAFILGSLIAVLLDLFNLTFRNVDDVARVLDTPVMAVVPLVKQHQQDDLANMFRSDAYSRFSESIRTLRTGILLEGGARHLQVILVTSSVPGEGKTTVAVNLAHALAQMDNVLLIDADLRRSMLGRVFSTSASKPGLTDIISGKASLAECIESRDGLDVLHAGSLTESPLELLSSARFAETLDALRGQYTRIVIDSPPIHAVSDASVLSTHADSVVYVLKSSTTTVAQAQKGIQQLRRHNAPVQGIVISQLELSKASQNETKRTQQRAFT